MCWGGAGGFGADSFKERVPLCAHSKSKSRSKSKSTMCTGSSIWLLWRITLRACSTGVGAQAAEAAEARAAAGREAARLRSLLAAKDARLAHLDGRVAELEVALAGAAQAQAASVAQTHAAQAAQAQAQAAATRAQAAAQAAEATAAARAAKAEEERQALRRRRVSITVVACCLRWKTCGRLQDAIGGHHCCGRCHRLHKLLHCHVRWPARPSCLAYDDDGI